VIDGGTNIPTTVTAGSGPKAVAVNRVTNKIYVTNNNSNTVTVIDGATNGTTTVTTGTRPNVVAVNPVTNKIYVSNLDSYNVTVIDGATNSTTTVAAGYTYAVAVNQVTNKIYLADFTGGNVIVIDGATNNTTTVAAGTGPNAVAVNPVTNKIYVTNNNSGTVTVVTEQSIQSIPLTTTITPLTNNTSLVSNPTIGYIVTSAYSPTATPVKKVYYQVDTCTGPWQQSTPFNSAGSFTIASQTNGIHIVYAFAGDGQEATSTNSGYGTSLTPGAITAYTLLINATKPDAPTAVTATAGNREATVSFTPPASNGGSPITSYTVTSSPGSIQATGVTSPITVTGLTNGISYTFTVTAQSVAGTGPASTPSNSVTPLSSPYSLNITFAGTGRGVVTGNGVYNGAPVGFSTDTSITVQLDDRTSASLHAAPSEYSLFTTWTGACSGTSDCSLIMSADMTATAVFDFDIAHKTRIYGTSNYFSTLAAAYSASVAGKVIQAWGTDFIETLTLSSPKAVTIKGGYNQGYTSNNGKTVLKGKLNIRNGSLTVENLQIR
jgi:YVTN family beta-propeller protein